VSARRPLHRVRKAASAAGAGGNTTIAVAAFALLAVIGLVIVGVEYARRDDGPLAGVVQQEQPDVTTGAVADVVGPASPGPVRSVAVGEAGAPPREVAERPRPPADEAARVAPAPSSRAVPVPAIDGRLLAMPVDNVRRSDLYASFDEPRGTRRHEAMDIMAPRGTPVRAAVDGRVAKLFRSDAGGLTVYQFDRDERLAYYYAHLDRYAEGLVEGQELRRGALLGFVGSTGNADADAPHLHFAVFVLGPDKKWWEGRAIDPYPLLTGRHPQTE